MKKGFMRGLSLALALTMAFSSLSIKCNAEEISDIELAVEDSQIQKVDSQTETPESQIQTTDHQVQEDTLTSDSDKTQSDAEEQNDEVELNVSDSEELPLNGNVTGLTYTVTYKSGKEIKHTDTYTDYDEFIFWDDDSVKTGYKVSGFKANDGKIYTEGQESAIIKMMAKGDTNITLTEQIAPIKYDVYIYLDYDQTKVKYLKNISYDSYFDLPTVESPKYYIQYDWQIHSNSGAKLEKEYLNAEETRVKNLTYIDGDVVELKPGYVHDVKEINYKSLLVETKTSGGKTTKSVKPLTEHIWEMNWNNPKNFDGEDIEEGNDTIELKTPSKWGYKFLGWYSDAKATKPVTTLKLDFDGTNTVYAAWEAKTYSIKYNANVPDNSKASLTGSMDTEQNGFTSGTAKKLLKNKFALKGYTFVGWCEKANGEDVIYKDESSVVNIYASKGCRNLYAIWKILNYKITYQNAVDGKNNVSNSNATSYTVEDGETLTLTEPTRTGYSFVGWYADANYKKQITEVDLSKLKNITVYARWKANTYTVNFDSNVPSNCKSQIKGKMPSTSCTYDKKKALSNKFSLSNYTFKGFNTKADGTGETVKALYNLSSDGSEVTLYAIWEPSPIAITYTDAVVGKNGVTANDNKKSFTIEDEGTYTLSSPSRKGFVFNGWYSDSKHKNLITSIDFSTKKPIKVYAGWTKTTYTVHFNANKPSGCKSTLSGTMDDVQCTYTVKKTLPKNKFVLSGYTFTGFNTAADGSGKKVTALYNLSEDGSQVNLYAQWKTKSYKITYVNATLGEDGIKENSNIKTYSAGDGDSYKLIDPVRRGYSFLGWYSDAALTKKITSLDLTVKKDIKVYASWSLGDFTYEVDDNVLYISGNGDNLTIPKDSSGNPVWMDCGATRAVVNLGGNPLDLSEMFCGMTALKSVKFEGLDTSKVTSMQGMFKDCSSLIWIDITGFDMSSVTDMSQMFSGCSSLKKLSLKNLNTSKVTDMSKLFYECTSLTSVDMTGIRTENVQDMSYMFYYCKEYDSIDVTPLNTSNVTNMAGMFELCIKARGFDFSKFDTSKVENMEKMFSCCSALTSLDLRHFNTSKVTNMSNMFENCRIITDLNLSSFDTTNVWLMGSMFEQCLELKKLDLSNFKTPNLYDMSSMFYNCIKLKHLDLSSFDTSEVKYMYNTFCECDELVSVEISGFDTSNVVETSHMFDGCTNLKYVDLSKWKTSNLKKMKYMFYNCKSLENIDVSNFDTSKLETMLGAFQNCASLKYIDVSKWNTAKAAEYGGMKRMFENCTALSDVDISNFTFEEGTDYTYLGLSESQLKK